MDDCLLLFNCDQCRRNNQLLGRIGFLEVNEQIIVNYFQSEIVIQYFELLIRHRNQFQKCMDHNCQERYLINEKGDLSRERLCKLHRDRKPKWGEKMTCLNCYTIQKEFNYSKCPKCFNPIIYLKNLENHFNCCYCATPICSKSQDAQQILPQMEMDQYCKVSNKFIYCKCLLTFLFLFIFSFVFIFTSFVFVTDILDEKINIIYLATLENFQQCPLTVKILMIIFLAIVFTLVKYIMFLIFWIPGAIYQYYTYLKKAYSILDY